MYNLHTKIVATVPKFRQLTCGEQLITLFTCPLTTDFNDLWSHYNYIIYVVKGRKIWHTAHGSHDLREGDCAFVRSGAAIVEQDFHEEFCFILFFMPDEFICDVLKSKATPMYRPGKKFESIIRIDTNAAVMSFYQSMMPFFDDNRQPDKALLNLKFRELILTLADNPVNSELLSCFCSMMQEPKAVSLQRVMEDNFCFNLSLEDFARLCHRSLSAFKRDFEKIFNSSPGRWLVEKRLDHALHLLTNTDTGVAEAAFESGFESASHFSRAFRQRFGTSPLSMKRQVLA